MASLSACHMLWYLHLCAEYSVIVYAYIDNAKGQISGDENGSTSFRQVELSPEVTVADANTFSQSPTSQLDPKYLLRSRYCPIVIYLICIFSNRINIFLRYK